MTTRAARSKRNRLANRRRQTAVRPVESRPLPLMVVRADGTLAPVVRPATDVPQA